MDPRESFDIEFTAKIEAARLETQARRDGAFVDIPFLASGIPIRQMCLPDFLALIAIGNAHVTGLQPPAEATASDCTQFWALHNAQLAWLLSPDFSPDASPRDAFLKNLGRRDHVEFSMHIAEYLRDTFADAPTPSRAVGGAPQADPFRVSFAARWYHRIATAYGWSRTEIRATPLRELFQLLRTIDAYDALKAGQFPGGATDETDRLWAEYLQKITALNSAT